MEEHKEKRIALIATLCFIALLVAFIVLLVNGKTISIRKDIFGLRDKSSFFKTTETIRSSASSPQSIASTGDTNTIFFGGRILTNPDVWSYRRTGEYHCPAIEFYTKTDIKEEKILTVVDRSFCNEKKVEVPEALEIFPRANLLFYVHTEKDLYIETIRLLIESTQ